MNNNIYYQNNLQTISNDNTRNSIDSSNNLANNYDYNKYSSLGSSISRIFNIPKQTNFLNYQPSTPTRNKYLINLGGNSKLKKPSNLSVHYKKIYDYDSLNNNNNNNYNKVDYRYESPPPNRYISQAHNNYFIPDTSNSQININLDERAFRLAKTPEPKNFKYNEYHSQNQYNINIYVNNSNNAINSIENQKQSFESPKKIKQIPNIYNEIDRYNNIKPKNNIQVKKLNNVNFSSLSNDINHNHINSFTKVNNITNQIIPNGSIYNSPVKKRYITLSEDINSNFYNSPQRNSQNHNYLLTNNINYYNSPQRTNKFLVNFQNNKYQNNLFSSSSNNLGNISYKNNNMNIIYNYQQPNIKSSNNYISPERHNSPMDNMKQKQSKNSNYYNKIKSDNFIKRLIPQKIIPNRVNYIPIPKKILIENNSDNKSYSNYINTSMNMNNIKYNTQLNIPLNNITNNINNIKNIQNAQNNYYTNLNKYNASIKHLNNILVQKEEPQNDFNPKEFKIIKKLGEGTFGKIYCIKWLKTNELFAMKKMELDEYDVYIFKKKVRLIQNFIKNTNHNGLIKLYGDKSIQQPKNNEFFYYVIMELAERDLEKEINIRRMERRYYSEVELLDMIIQLVKTLSLMQKNNITHRDVKPQNILLLKGMYKLCDFGETKIITGVGPILQSVRGSELYMSPILFYAYNRNVLNVLHNTYKSDVFSLGMCTLLTACLSPRPLCDIREIKNMVTIETIIINNLINRYSKKMINLILKMLEIDENLRMDFIQLANYISNAWPDKEYCFK